MIECRICGDALQEKDAQDLNEMALCRDCKVLQDSAELLMTKSPEKSIYYFTDLFMRARKYTLSEEKLKDCIWNAWWNNQKKLPAN